MLNSRAIGHPHPSVSGRVVILSANPEAPLREAQTAMENMEIRHPEAGNLSTFGALYQPYHITCFDLVIT